MAYPTSFAAGPAAATPRKRPGRNRGVITSLACALLALTSLAAPRPAQAYYGWYGYETMGFGPTPVYVTGTRPMLSAANQYYDATLRGVRRLCQNQPALCQEPAFDARLRRLEHMRIAGTTMAWTGMATAVLGPLISTSVNCARSGSACRPNEWVVLGTVVGGLAVGITGLAISPSVHDAIDLVNDINRRAPDHPVQLHFSLLDGEASPGGKARAAQVGVSSNF